MRTSNQGLESKKEKQAIRGRQGAEGQRRMPGGSRCRGARRHRHHRRGLPFKSRHRPRPAAAAGTSPLTAAARRSAAPAAAAAAAAAAATAAPAVAADAARPPAPASSAPAGSAGPRPARPRHGVLDHLPPGGVSAVVAGRGRLGGGGGIGLGGEGCVEALDGPLRGFIQQSPKAHRPYLGSPETRHGV